MFSYYLKLGLFNLRRNPLLTALMVITLAVGVAASVSTLTILHGMSSDPIPNKSAHLLVPVIESESLSGYVPGERTDHEMMTYRDATNLMDMKIGANRTVLYGTGAPVESSRPELGMIDAEGVATTSAFFTMFDVPFKLGSAWNADDDQRKSKVVVLSKPAAEKFFGDENPVGKTLRLWHEDFQVVGVLDKWNPVPHYFNLVQGEDQFVGETDFYVPFATGIATNSNVHGSVWCSYAGPKPGVQGLAKSECTWLQFWIEASSDAQVSQIKDQIDAYTKEQNKLGRLPRHAPNELLNVNQWMQYLHIVGNESRISTWLSFGFLLLCLVNTIGLLLAKFSGRASEVGVRRALGASKAEIFKQFIVETAVLGLVGGVIGLLLSYAGLWIISQQTRQLAVVAHMDLNMLIFNFALAVFASVVAGLFPTWRACQVMPAIQLKSQ